MTRLSEYPAAVARGRTAKVLARGFDASGGSGRIPRRLVVEEPLEIRLGDTIVATTMRTPGSDFELAAGWCWSEGLITAAPQEVRYCATESAVETGFNVVTVVPDPTDSGHGGSSVVPRIGLATSSCGICGAEQIEALTARLEPLPDVSVDLAALLGLDLVVKAEQSLFDATGGAHAAAILDGSGRLVGSAEDIGRHNAVDKVVGRLILDGNLPEPGSILWTSGRASLEILQKAWAAGVSAVVAVGAASSLAVETASEANVVLAGFARGDHLSVYAGADRIAT